MNMLEKTKKFNTKIINIVFQKLNYLEKYLKFLPGLDLGNRRQIPQQTLYITEQKKRGKPI